MTMIGAMHCFDGVVLLADGQETITDYAKWDVEKMKTAHLNGAVRIVMTGAGDADNIDMIWEKVSALWGSWGPWQFSGYVSELPNLSIKQWRKKIVSIVNKVTKECIIPSGESNAQVELIWLIQDTISPRQTLMWPFELFRTNGLRERNIRPYYFGGSPILLTRYLSDMYLNCLWMTDEARALAAYLLWEAKERDPNVGKHSDIVIFQHDGTYHRLSQEEIEYWEDHFRVLKREMAILPLLSCATGVIRQSYDLKDRIERLTLAIKALAMDQERMRQGKRKPGHIDDSLGPQIRKLGERQNKRQKAKQPQSNPQTSEG
jgi:hypothetical protein